MTNYQQTLRVLGQVLEAFQAQGFDVVCYQDCYLVRCKTKQSEKKLKALSAILRMWTGENPPSPGPDPRPTMNVELLYTPKEVEFLDQEWKAKRREPQGMPDPYSLSNILRSVGTYLNRKGKVRLILASSHDHRIVALYETSRGVRKVEEYELSSFYDLWVETYVKKKKKERFRAA